MHNICSYGLHNAILINFNYHLYSLIKAQSKNIILHSWNFLDKYGNPRISVFPIWAIALGLEIWEGFCFLLMFSIVCNILLSNLNMYAMMQCKAKSENLAHILGYQIWAVTKDLRRWTKKNERKIVKAMNLRYLRRWTEHS